MAAIRRLQLFAHYWKRPARPVAEGIPALPRRARRNSSALSLVSPRTSGEDSIRRRHLTFTPARRPDLLTEADGETTTGLAAYLKARDGIQPPHSRSGKSIESTIFGASGSVVRLIVIRRRRCLRAALGDRDQSWPQYPLA